MNRTEWRRLLLDHSETPCCLRALVDKHAIDIFDDNDLRVMRLANSWDWPGIAAGVRAEMRLHFQQAYDPKAPCFDPKQRIYHVIRRVVAPANVITGLKAKRMQRITL